jgi:hypothetical protein
MIAVHFENLLFLLFVAGAFLFQLLARAASKTSKNADESQRRSRSRPQAPPPIPRAPAESDEERIRKFLEALGQPTTSKPPRKRSGPTYQKPVVLPHAPPFASPLPPLTTRPPAEPPRRVTLPRQITHPPYETKSFRPTVAEPAVFEVQEAAATTEPPRLIATAAAAYAAATQQKVTPEGREKGIVALLKSPSGLREAIVLREIFAPPLSLRAIDSDLIGSA